MGLFNRSSVGNEATGRASESTLTPDAASPANPAFDATTQEPKTNEFLDDTPPPLLTARTAIMAIIAAMGGFIFGYDTGQISGFLEMKVFLERFGSLDPSTGAYSFSNVRSGLIVGLLSIGTLIGCLIAAPLSNKYGRKTCMPFWCIVFAIGVTIQLSVGAGGFMWVGIVMGRWVAGLGVGALSVLVPLYTSEATPKQIRGAVVCCYQLFITIGIFTADCINYGTETRTDTGSYRIPMGIGYIWALILGVGILFMPESPRWDIKNGNHERAFNTMTSLAGVSRQHRAIHHETQEINKAIDASQGNHPWWEVFTAPKMGYRTALGMALQMFQQLTGANYFFYYGTSVFSGVGISNSYVTAMILGGVNVLTTFLGLYMVEKFGRRKSLFWGAICMFICFMVFASVGHFCFYPASQANQTSTPTAEEHTYGTVLIIFACLFILAFASTWGPMVWTVIGEMFPYRYRATSMAFATAANWFWNFMLAFFTPFITAAIDYRYGYVFAACNLVAALLVWFFLMESAGRTLEEVDTMYLAGVPVTESHKWTSEQVGELIVSDNMYYDKGAKGISKRNEAARENAAQVENVNDHQNITVMDSDANVMGAAGARP